MRNISVDLGSIYSSLDLKLNKFDSSINKAVQGFYKLQLGTTKASSIMDKSVFTATSNISKSYQLWEKANDGVGKSMEASKKKTESLKSQIKLLDGEIKKSEEILADVEKQCGKNSKEAETYRSKVLDMKLVQAELTKEMKDTEKETTTFAGKLNLLEKEFDKIDKKYEAFDKVGDKFSSMGSKLTMGVTLPIVGAGTAATKFAFDFEKGAAKVSTIADTTKVSMDTLKKGVVDLSNDTGLSTSELNESLYQAISGSVDTTKAVDFLNVAVKSAKGGFTDTATAVDGLTTVLNSYGMEADKANDIANQMLITQNLGKTTFGELASAVGKVTPVASALGVKTEELFSSLATTTAQGLATAESVTALKAAMSNIIKPSKEAGDAAEMLGIKFSASEVKSKGWMPFLKDLKEKLAQASPEFEEVSKQIETNVEKMYQLEKAGKKNSDEYKRMGKANKRLINSMELLAKASDSPLSAFATMFGSVEGLNSILMLTTESGMAKYNDAMKEMKNNTGALDDAYKKMSETTENKFHKSLNKAKNSAMELGIKLFPTIEKGINLISDLTDKFSKLSPVTQENIIKIGLASAALGPFMKVTGGTIKGVNKLIKLGPKVKTFFKIFKGAKGAVTATKGLEVAAGATTKGLGLMTTSGGVATKAMGLLGKVCSPVGIAIAGVGAVVYGVKKYNDAMGESCLKSSEDMGFMEKSLLKATGQVVYSKDELDKYNLKHKEFQNVSKETNKTLKETTQNVGELKLKLSSNANMSGMIDKKDSDELIQKIEKIFEDAKKAVETKSSEARAKIEEALKAEDGILDKREQEMIKKQDEMNETRLKKLDELHKRIKEKEQKLSKVDGEEKTKLVESLKKDLDEVAKIKMEATVKSNEELKNVKQQFNKEIANLDLEGSIKIFNQQRDATKKEIEATRKKYDEQIAAIKEYSKNAEGEDRKYWDNKINSLELQKNETIDKEREKLLGILGVVKEKFPEVTRLYDIETGKQLSRSEKAKQEELENYAKKMTGLYGITQSGWYKIRNEQDGKLHEIYVDVDNVTGGIQGIWDTTVQGVYGNPIKAREQIADELRNGVVFREIANNYNTVKDDIYNNRLNVAYPSVPNNLFDSIRTQWANTINKVGWGSYHGGMSVPSNYQGYASGTTSATRGWHEVAENGFEIVTDRQYRWFNGGEKVLNNSDSQKLLKNINWYSEGAIFTRPTVLGNIGVGDANNGYGSAPEAVLPIDKLEDYLYNAFVKAIEDTGVGNINMDGRKFIERLSPHMAMATKGRR